MSEIISTIKAVAKFADQQANPLIQGFGAVVFHKGEVWAQSNVGGACAETGLKLSCAVPAGPLLKALQALKGEPAMEVQGDKLLLSCDGSTARIPTIHMNSLPKLNRPGKKAIWVEVGGLNHVNRVSWSVSQDTTKRNMQGVHFSSTRVEATNGHSLASWEINGNLDELGEMLVSPDVLVGLPQVTKLSRVQGHLFIALDESHWRVAQLVDAKFPPIDQMEESWKSQPMAVIQKEALLDVLKRAKCSQNQATIDVTGDRMTLETVERQGALFDFATFIQLQQSDQPIPEGCIGFNLDSMIKMVTAAPGVDLELHMTPDKGGGLGPLVVISEGYQGVLMPLRI